MFKRFRLTRRRSATPTRSSVSGLQKVTTTTNIKRTYTGRSPSPQIYKKYITNIYWKVTTTRCALVSSLSAIPCRRRPHVLATWRCSLFVYKPKKRFLKSISSLQACLLDDKVDNSYCHQQLQVCLREEEDGEHYREVLREEEHWAKVVRLLLAKEH